jgi:hypothetical protein
MLYHIASFQNELCKKSFILLFVETYEIARLNIRVSGFVEIGVKGGDRFLGDKKIYLI